MSSIRHYLAFIALTPIFFILAMWASILPHEYAHSLMAYWWGDKADPWAIYYGHFNWQNILFASGIDENVNYELIAKLGHRPAIGWVGFAGSGMATLVIYLVSVLLLNVSWVKKHSWLFYFICWISIINLSELFSYIFLRSFSTHGDIAHIEYGWQISPWLIFVPGCLFLFCGLLYFFKKTLIDVYTIMQLNNKFIQLLFLFVCTYVFFGMSGIRMYLDPYGKVANLLGISCFVIMLLVIILCWPWRRHSH